jgi:hypothetical protein
MLSVPLDHVVVNRSLKSFLPELAYAMQTNPFSSPKSWRRNVSRSRSVSALTLRMSTIAFQVMYWRRYLSNFILDMN